MFNGNSLDRSVRRFLEARFDTSLADVCVHTGPVAASLAGLLGARAFAAGNHIYFGEGEYAPGAGAGMALLAHEVAHCLQQRRGRWEPQAAAWAGDSAEYESEADDSAARVLAGTRVPALAPDRWGALRRAVSIVPGSAQIRVTQHPSAPAPTFSATEIQFRSHGLIAQGSVQLRGSAGDSAAGWRAGFIQAQWIETNWVYYRGQQNSHGSIFFQRARPPARASQACRDCLNTAPLNDMFYGELTNGFHLQLEAAAGAPFPITLQPNHRDFPNESINLVERNATTHQDNYLREAQLEFFFCTVLTVREPGGRFHLLKSIYWNVRWQVTVNHTNTGGTLRFTAHLNPQGTGSGISGVIDGEPNDRRFTGVLTSRQTKNCNAIAGDAEAHAIRRESNVWHNFDVRN